MRIIVSGSRNWTDRYAFGVGMHYIVESYAMPGFDSDGKFVDYLTNDWTIVHGGARGIDTMAGEWAIGHFMAVEVFPADWEKHGKAAGPIRNREMAAAGADLCVAFPLGESRGTRDMMRVAEAAGIPVITPSEVRARED